MKKIYLSLCQHCCMRYHPVMLTGYLKNPGNCDMEHGFNYAPGELAMVYFEQNDDELKA